MILSPDLNLNFILSPCVILWVFFFPNLKQLQFKNANDDFNHFCGTTHIYVSFSKYSTSLIKSKKGELLLAEVLTK